VPLDPNFYLAAAITVIGGIAWALRLEGRVNTTQSRFDDLKADVQYIRSRIDRAINGD
jgi:hypothetical protein